MHKILFFFIFSSIFVLSYGATNLNLEIKAPANFEEDFIIFFEDYLYSLKHVIAEPNDEKAISKIHEIKNEFIPRGLKLSEELQGYRADFTKEMEASFVKRMKHHPVMVDLYQVLFNPAFLERIEKNEEFKLAVNELKPINDMLEGKNSEFSTQEVAHLSILKGSQVIAIYTLVNNLKEKSVALNGPDKKTLELQIEGLSDKKEIQLFFFIDADKPKTNVWKENARIVVVDKSEEITYVGVKGKGEVIIEKLGPPGGLIEGKFSGIVFDEKIKLKKFKVSGDFKAIREVEK